eukprot:s1055_g19.t1
MCGVVITRFPLLDQFWCEPAQRGDTAQREQTGQAMYSAGEKKRCQAACYAAACQMTVVSVVAGLAVGASCDFERVDGASLSAEEFRKRFRTGPLGPGRPVVLTGIRVESREPVGTVSRRLAMEVLGHVPLKVAEGDSIRIAQVTDVHRFPSTCRFWTNGRGQRVDLETYRAGGEIELLEAVLRSSC